jgi:nickel transport protein
MKLGTAALLALVLGFLARPVFAHEVLHTVERGRAVAVKAYFADGEVMAYTEYQLWSPADPRIPYQKGRTDRGGSVAFMPDREGAWHLKIADNTGHGLDTTIDVGALAPTQSVTSLSFILRPVLAIVILVVLFAGLFLTYRRKKTA